MAMIFEISFDYVILSFACGLLIQTWVQMADKLLFNTHKCDNVYAHIPPRVEFQGNKFTIGKHLVNILMKHYHVIKGLFI